MTTTDPAPAILARWPTAHVARWRSVRDAAVWTVHVAGHGVTLSRVGMAYTVDARHGSTDPVVAVQGALDAGPPARRLAFARAVFA